MALIYCSECGKKISSLSSTCPHCGAELEPPPQAPELPDSIFCSSCGARISSKSIVCPQCGAPAEQIPEQQYIITQPPRRRRKTGLGTGAIISFIIGGGAVLVLLGFVIGHMVQ